MDDDDGTICNILDPSLTTGLRFRVEEIGLGFSKHRAEMSTLGGSNGLGFRVNHY